MWMSPQVFIVFRFFYTLFLLNENSDQVLHMNKYTFKCRWGSELFQQGHCSHVTVGHNLQDRICCCHHNYLFETTCSFQSRSQHFLLLTLDKLPLKASDSQSDSTNVLIYDIITAVWRVL